MFGATIIYDTLCANNAILKGDEGRIIVNRNMTSTGEMFQMIHLQNDKKGVTEHEFNTDEQEFDRDYDKYAMLNVVMSEEYNHLNQIPVKNCASWNSKKEHTDPKLVLSMVTHALSSFNAPNARAIVTLVSEMEPGHDNAAIWEVSINQGQIYVNELSSVILNRSEIDNKH